MLGSAIHWMIGRTDAHLISDGAEAANLAIGDAAMLPDVREVPQRAIFQRAVGQNFTLLADVGFTQTHTLINPGVLESGGHNGGN